MVKAVSDVDSRRTDSIDELLRYWLECAPKLDFRKDLTAPPSDQSWASYAVDEVRLIKDSLRGILERDAVVLPVSAVAAVDALLDDPVLTALESTKKVVELHTRIRPDLTRLVMLGSDAPSAVEIRETFAGRVRH